MSSFLVWLFADVGDFPDRASPPRDRGSHLRFWRFCSIPIRCNWCGAVERAIGSGVCAEFPSHQFRWRLRARSFPSTLASDCGRLCRPLAVGFFHPFSNQFSTEFWLILRHQSEFEFDSQDKFVIINRPALRQFKLLGLPPFSFALILFFFFNYFFKIRFLFHLFPALFLFSSFFLFNFFCLFSSPFILMEVG